MSPDALPGLWRTRAKSLKRWVLPVAEAFEEAAAELDAALKERAIETLTLRQAARESGYSEGWLGRMVKAGKIRNVGRRHAPRILRADLPRKIASESGTRHLRAS